MMINLEEEIAEYRDVWEGEICAVVGVAIDYPATEQLSEEPDYTRDARIVLWNLDMGSSIATTEFRKNGRAIPGTAKPPSAWFLQRTQLDQVPQQAQDEEFCIPHEALAKALLKSEAPLRAVACQ